jgi:hypothetical protein
MRYSTLIIFILFCFIAGCNIVNLEEPTTPEVKVSPSKILIDQEVEIRIQSHKKFFLPYCGGKNFTIQERQGDIWEDYHRQQGFCNGLIPPRISVNKSTTIYYTFTETGTYRFVSSYKSDPDDEWKTFTSFEFEVEAKE